MSPSLKSIDPGPDPPKIIDVMIEIPKNSKIKYEVDTDSGMLRVNRILSVSIAYPCNYGFIPGTLEEGSKDPIDTYVVVRRFVTSFHSFMFSNWRYFNRRSRRKRCQDYCSSTNYSLSSLAKLMTYEILLHFLGRS